MDTGIVFGMALALLATAVVVWSLTRVARRRAVPPRTDVRPPVTRTGPNSATVVLDVPGGDPSGPAIQRLAQEAAVRIFALMPELEEVEIRSSAGLPLGVRKRTQSPAVGPIALPQHLLEPHAPSHHEANPVHPGAEDEPLSGPVAGPSFARSTSPYFPPPRKFSERFELPGAVLELITDPVDPVEVVRAILEAGGRMVEPDEEILRVDDLAIVVLRTGPGTVPSSALDHAFLRIQQSGAARGLVISTGLLPWRDVRRREAAAPHVVHVGPDAIQRMADAVAVGADPLRFAQGPALGSSLPTPEARVPPVNAMQGK